MDKLCRRSFNRLTMNCRILRGLRHVALLLSGLGLLLLFSAGCQRSEMAAHGPTGTALYLRGTFNNWDTSHPMEYSPQYGYLATITLPAGQYQFKFADESWGAFDFGAGAEGIKFGETFALLQHGGNLGVNLDRTMTLIFAVVVTSPTEASARVILDEAAQGSIAPPAQS